MSPEAMLSATLAGLESAPEAAWREEQLRCALLVVWTHALREACLPEQLAGAILQRVATGPS